MSDSWNNQRLTKRSRRSDDEKNEEKNEEEEEALPRNSRERNEDTVSYQRTESRREDKHIGTYAPPPYFEQQYGPSQQYPRHPLEHFHPPPWRQPFQHPYPGPYPPFMPPPYPPPGGYQQPPQQRVDASNRPPYGEQLGTAHRPPPGGPYRSAYTDAMQDTYYRAGSDSQSGARHDDFPSSPIVVGSTLEEREKYRSTLQPTSPSPRLQRVARDIHSTATDSSASVSASLTGEEKSTKKGQKTPRKAMDQKSRREKKNFQSRVRAAKLRDKIEDVKRKAEEAKSQDELEQFESFEARRRRKNERSRQRAIEKKNEIENILGKPESERTKEEKETLQVALEAKYKKNEGDRKRRERIKMGLEGDPRKSSSRTRPAQSGGASLPSASSMYPPNVHSQMESMSDIPQFSPVPPDLTHPMSSPTGFVSPGGLQSILGFPSPPTSRRRSETTGPGDLETHGAGSSRGTRYPLLPPDQPQGRLYQRTGLIPRRRPTPIQQQRHADGSYSISIGGQRSSGRPFSEEGPVSSRTQTTQVRGTTNRHSDNMTDMPNLLLYGGSIHDDQGEDSDDIADPSDSSGRRSK